MTAFGPWQRPRQARRRTILLTLLATVVLSLAIGIGGAYLNRHFASGVGVIHSVDAHLVIWLSLALLAVIVTVWFVVGCRKGRDWRQ
jgi:hypothetical protein